MRLGATLSWSGHVAKRKIPVPHSIASHFTEFAILALKQFYKSKHRIHKHPVKHLQTPKEIE
jgi:hypothetical protein